MDIDEAKAILNTEEGLTATNGDAVISALMTLKTHVADDEEAERLYQSWHHRVLSDLPDPDNPDFNVPDFPPSP